MSYGFDMGFAQANSLQEAMAIALEYTQSQMTEKNIRKTIRDNRYYIPSVRTGYIADEESRNRRADTLADTADRCCLLSLRGIVGADQIVQWDTRYGEMTGKDNAIGEE